MNSSVTNLGTSRWCGACLGFASLAYGVCILACFAYSGGCVPITTEHSDDETQILLGTATGVFAFLAFLWKVLQELNEQRDKLLEWDPASWDSKNKEQVVRSMNDWGQFYVGIAFAFSLITLLLAAGFRQTGQLVIALVASATWCAGFLLHISFWDESKAIENHVANKMGR